MIYVDIYVRDILSYLLISLEKFQNFSRSILAELLFLDRRCMHENFRFCREVENQNVFKGVLMFIPEENLFVYAFFGNGDNLFEEDEELGYDDYAMINTYKFVTSEFIEEDGGQLLFKTKETSYYEDLNSFCKDTLEMVDQLFDPATLEILQIT